MTYRKFKNFICWQLVILLCTQAVVPISTADVQISEDEQIITYVMPYEFAEYSPFKADSYATTQWLSAIMSGLYERESTQGRIWKPDLADGMPVQSTDGKTITVKLKPNLKFATGESLTVEDVVFSYQVALTPAINQNNYYSFSNYLSSNESIKKINDETVEFTFSKSIGFYMNILDLGIIDKTEFLDDYNDCVLGNLESCEWNNPNGADARSAGPFFVEDIDTNNMIITLRKNAHYYNEEEVMADKIIIEKIAVKDIAVDYLIEGSVDILDAQYILEIDLFDSYEDINSQTIGDTAHHEISLNHLHPYFGTGEAIPGNNGNPDSHDAREIRRAMSHIINRSYIVNEMLNGMAIPATTSMPITSIGYDNHLKPREYNIDKARNIMESIGFDYSNLDYNNEKDSYESFFFNITLLSANSGTARNNFMELLEQNLPKIGIGIQNHVSTGWDIIIPRTFGHNGKPPIYDEGGFDVFSVGYYSGLEWDPSGLYQDEGFCDIGDCSNFYNYDNQTIDLLIEDYVNELDPLVRIDKVKTIQKAIYDDIPVIPLFYPMSHWASRNNVNGLDVLLLGNSMQQWQKVSKSEWSRSGDGGTSDLRNGQSSNNSTSPTLMSTEFKSILLLIAIGTIVVIINRKRFHHNPKNLK